MRRHGLGDQAAKSRAGGLTIMEGESSMGEDLGGFLNTRRAATYLDLSPRTLDGYRVSGEGPAFHRFGNRVRYRRSDLDLWAAGRWATTTAEADRLTSACGARTCSPRCREPQLPKS